MPAYLQLSPPARSFAELAKDTEKDGDRARLYASLRASAYAYTRTVLRYEIAYRRVQRLEAGAAEELAELETARTRAHDALIGAINPICRAFARFKRHQRWLTRLVGDRSRSTIFALAAVSLQEAPETKETSREIPEPVEPIPLDAFLTYAERFLTLKIGDEPVLAYELKEAERTLELPSDVILRHALASLRT